MARPMKEHGLAFQELPFMEKKSFKETLKAGWGCNSVLEQSGMCKALGLVT